ncbi:MAG: DNA mismatch repair endonuclease MutL [Planctomycetota bacterium]
MPPRNATSPRAVAEIQLLPPLVVNQIAAGEVVERPASVVKELLDNAIDAGATRIAVELERGGVELIRIADNGAGIPPEQLPLAIHPHATSKIRSTDDLDRIATMGFRGEALASIASVSRMSIRSRTPDADGAVRIDVDGGDVREPRPDAGPVGTSVAVRNLFFNTPARRKFVRTDSTEQGHCADLVRALAMSHPAIGFTLLADGRELLALPPDQPVRERAFDILGRESEEQYLEVAADRFDDARGLALWGLVGLPSIAKRVASKAQHVFLNGRPIRDKTIMHAMREAYRGLIEPGRHPSALLMLEMDPGAVDVNVHPTKAEVRFRDQSMVHKTVYLAVREALQRSDLTPAPDATHGVTTGRAVQFEPYAPGGGASGEPKDTGRADFTSFFEQVKGGDTSSFDFEGLRAAVDAERERLDAERAELAQRRAQAETRVVPSETGGVGAEPESLPLARPADRVLQVHNSFLVTQDADGVVIIDQHALHERVMFEKLRDRLEAGELESQRLLMPEVVETTETRVDLLGPLAPLLQRLGITAEPMGLRSVAIHSFPSFLFERKVEPAPFLAELLERAEEEDLASAIATDGGSSAREQALHEVLDMMACKAAIKAGDAMSDEELNELLLMRDQIERASNCPHGRPTAIRLTIREIERQFGRS